MNNIINRINNEFDFNYQKFVKNNNIAKITSIKETNAKPNKWQDNNAKPVEVETIDLDLPQKDPEETEILKLDD